MLTAHFIKRVWYNYKNTKERIMRKIITFLSVMAICLSFCACGAPQSRGNELWVAERIEANGASYTKTEYENAGNAFTFDLVLIYRDSRSVTINDFDESGKSVDPRTYQLKTNEFSMSSDPNAMVFSPDDNSTPIPATYENDVLVITLDGIKIYYKLEKITIDSNIQIGDGNSDKEQWFVSRIVAGAITYTDINEFNTADGYDFPYDILSINKSDGFVAVFDTIRTEGNIHSSFGNYSLEETATGYKLTKADTELILTQEGDALVMDYLTLTMGTVKVYFSKNTIEK